MQHKTNLTVWCERILEGGWLLVLSLIPIYFNLFSARHFEPDKATTLRSIVLVMAAVALIRAIEFARSGAKPAHAEPSAMTSSNPLHTLWQKLSALPMGVPILFYVLIFLLATALSIVPHVSLWGSYQRMQGTYTNLSYIILFLIIVTTVQRRDQLERIISIILLTGLVVSFYGIVQNRGLDPLPWRGDVVQRVASTMGNAIFVAAYLLMVLPLALYRFLDQVITLANRRFNRGEESDTHGRAATDTPANPLLEFAWAFAYVIMIIGTMALMVASVNLAATVRTEHMFWWLFPGAIAISTLLWTMTTVQMERGAQRVSFWPGGLLALYVVAIPIFISRLNEQASTIVFQPKDDLLNWWDWLFIGVGAIILFYVLAYLLPRLSRDVSLVGLGLRATGSFLVILSVLTTIVFSQSRGPQLGLIAAIFTFVTLFIWLARRRIAQRTPESKLAGAATVTMWGWFTLSIVGIIFLVVFNISNTPVFEQLREVRYFGRLGTLVSASQEGTGKVRWLIWRGDEYGSGTIGMVTDNAYRTVFGWGPESMFVAFNKFYPPSLARLEMRTASPDRAHQVILDEIATRGILGLISYFFLIISFGVFCWRSIRHSQQWQWQFFFVACFSTVVGHVMEGMTGIPIVSTLTMLWVTMALAVSGARLSGLHPFESTPEPATAPDADTAAQQEEETPQTSTHDTSKSTASSNDKTTARKGAGAASGGSTSKRKGRGGSSRGSGGRGGGTPARRGGTPEPRTHSQPVSSQVGANMLVLYIALLIGALIGAWQWNIKPIYADMHYHQSTAYSEQAGGNIDFTLHAFHHLMEAIRMEPQEDYYYLNLGRVLMTLAEEKRALQEQMIKQQQNKENLTAEEQRDIIGYVRDQNVSIDDLRDLQSPDALSRFVQESPPIEIVHYADASLKRARELSPYNKDHYANLGRLNNFLFNWTREIRYLEDAARWYEQANEVAPQDVALINEHAQIQLLLISVAENQGNNQAAMQHYQKLAQLYEKSLLFDASYGEAATRLPNIYLKLGEFEKATEMFVPMIKQNPHEVAPQINMIVGAMNGHPDLLREIRAAFETQADDDAILHSVIGLLSVRVGDAEGAVEAYERAVALDPDNLEHRLNYSIMLSDTLEYQAALQESQEGLSLAQKQNGGEASDANQKEAQFQVLVSSLETLVANNQ